MSRAAEAALAAKLTEPARSLAEQAAALIKTMPDLSKYAYPAVSLPEIPRSPESRTAEHTAEMVDSVGELVAITRALVDLTQTNLCLLYTSRCV